MRYLALKRLLCATGRIPNEGDERSAESVQPAKRLQQTQSAGPESTEDLMGLSMFDDGYLSFQWVSVQGLTLVLKARSGLRETFQVDCCTQCFQRNTLSALAPYLLRDCKLATSIKLARKKLEISFSHEPGGE